MRTLWAAWALMASGGALADGGAAIPFKQDSAGAAAALPGGALGVLLVSALAIAAVYWIRKRLNLPLPGKDAGRHLRVLQTERLGPRTLLSVVEFAGGRYLIAQSEQGVSCLAQAAGVADDAVPAAAAAPKEAP
ncbi:flagellar biosynthetic protein FliO [Duganella sp. HH105]|uniref:flagellar biosynthetic protein FliO n=1 Tax=Duganella sp. HH105 TaxID=1781067 RepID=UPI000877E5F9|nr:flagellar biosynthetic protein FliO [Duganella sp. HH105]OEZ52849.1 flagellar biosynthesis protein, FliO [Duganella sp. HH105]